MVFLIYLQIALLASFVIFVFFMEGKNVKLFNPPILISIIYLIEYGVSTLYMVSDPAHFWRYDFYEIGIVNKGLLFVNLVFILFLLGYYSPKYSIGIRNWIVKIIDKIPDINKYTIQIKNLILMIVILLIAGWTARILVILCGGYYHIESGNAQAVKSEFYDTYSQYLVMGSLLPTIALSLIFSEWLTKNKQSYLFVSVLFLLLEILYALPSGSKERILLPISLVLFMYSLKKKLPIIPLLITVVLFILFVFPFVGIYRNIVLSGNVFNDMLLVSYIYFQLFENFGVTISEIFNYIFADRFNFSIVISAIVEKTPAVWDFKYGYTYFIFFLSIIPRIIWPDKPGIAIYGNEFGRMYGFISPVDFGTSIDMGWVGEMFVNFGWFGIVCGFFYGLFYRVIYEYFIRDGRFTPLSGIFYVLTLYYMLRGGMFALQFSGLMKILLVVCIILLPFARRVKRRTQKQEML